MDVKKIRESISADWEKVESLIRSSLSSDIGILNAVNGRLLSHSGKQLRPLLSILVARACSGGHPTEASFRIAAAVELLHNATLLHDDVADESNERRGVPTLRALMGSSVAVLVGDFWLVRAVQLVLGDEGEGTNDRVVRLFSKTLCDLAEGEMLQLQKSGTGDTTQEDCYRIIYGKTASFFETAAVSAAISVGAEPAVEKAVGDYALALGMAFQIRDDIFDYQLSSPAVGKPVGVDVCEGLITLPLVGALRAAEAGKEEEIRSKVVTISGHPEYRDEIISFVRENGGIEFAYALLDEYVDEALAALEGVPDCRERGWLVEFARYMAERDS